MTLFDGLMICYAIIGFLVFCGFCVSGWNTGDAADFIIMVFIGGCVGFFWLPALS